MTARAAPGRRTSGRGRPLRAAGLFFALWIGARLLLWESPFVQAVAAMPPQVAVSAAATIEAAAPAAAPARAVRAVRLIPPRFAATDRRVLPAQGPDPALPAIAAPRTGLPAALALGSAEAGEARAPAVPWPGLSKPAPGSASRWSADAWLLWREALGPVRAQQGFVAPAYGARQVGAVIRYRLAPGSVREPTLYLRGTRALERAHEDEAALGLALRPVKGLPVMVGAELRGGDVGGSVRLRPALLAVTQLPAVALPLGTRAEAYLQGGYVGGPFATPFADGQLRLTRRLADLHGMELRAGAGAWGGAQRGAARLDLGPTADVAVPLGPLTTRLSADWRFRMAGDAIPGSGPAVTLSAGF